MCIFILELNRICSFLRIPAYLQCSFSGTLTLFQENLMGRSRPRARNFLKLNLSAEGLSQILFLLRIWHEVWKKTSKDAHIPWAIYVQDSMYSKGTTNNTEEVWRTCQEEKSKYHYSLTMCVEIHSRNFIC